MVKRKSSHSFSITNRPRVKELQISLVQNVDFFIASLGRL